MHNLKLASTHRSTTQLGYGCSGLMGALSLKDSLGLLNAAFDAGIRHFDVAPMYGFGAAEECLGEFLQQHHAVATVTTKYGIPPARNRWFLDAARGIAKPVLGLLPGLKQRMARAANQVAGTGARLPFTAERAMTSLHESLRKLRVERIDLFLMHEASAGDLSDETLLEALRGAVEAGKIGAFGVGSDADSIPALTTERAPYCEVIQCDWSVAHTKLPETASFRIHHRSLAEHFRALQVQLDQSASLRKQWSEEIGADLGAEGMLGKLMMRAAMDQNPDGILLFSSRSPRHMRANVELTERTDLTAAASRLYELVQREKFL